jgi:hypothetical protein
MKWVLSAAGAVFATVLAGSALAAQPDEAAPRPGAAAPGDEAITFEEYRDWRLAAMERRRSEIDMQLAIGDLPAPRKARLEETRSYYKWLAGLPETDRDRRFRERFDRIDANHDGILDPGERAAWRERQRAYYGSGSARQ